MIVSFSVLLYYGYDIYKKAPPIPDKVVSTDGTVLFTGQDIKDGQNVWQSIGGQELGTVWGHGSYVASDWSADWFHREAVCLLDELSFREFSKTYDALDAERKAMMDVRLQKIIRTNTFDEVSKEIKVDSFRKAAIIAVSSHYKGLFMDDPQLNSLRNAYAIPVNTI